MAELAVRGATLSFDDAGSGDAPFVFIHGWACDRTFWRPQFEDLSRDHRCVSVDLRGRGGSSATPPFDVFTAADDVAALIRELGLPPAIVAGHSLGGIVALILEERNPELVAGLVTGDSPIAAGTGSRWQNTVSALREAQSMEPVQEFIETFFAEKTDPDLAADIRAIMLTCDPEVAAGMLEEGDRLSDQMAGLVRAADRKPFMAIWAEKPLGEPNLVRELTMFARQEPVAESGHFFQLEQPELTNALLRAFVDDVRRDPRTASEGS